MRAESREGARSVLALGTFPWRFLDPLQIVSSGSCVITLTILGPDDTITDSSAAKIRCLVTPRHSASDGLMGYTWVNSLLLLRDSVMALWRTLRLPAAY